MTQPGNARWTIALATALIALATAATLLIPRETSRSVQASGPGAGMGLRVFADVGKTQLVCDTGLVQRECDIIGDSPFSISVVTNPQPAGGFTAYQAVVRHAALLTLKQQVGTSENVWPHCDAPLASEDKTVANQYLTICGSGTITNISYTGPLVNLRFTCPSQGGSAQVDLIGGGGTAVSKYVRSGIQAVVFLKSVTKGTIDVADSVVINCLPDADGDGMPDVFEKAHPCLDQSVPDAGVDDDGDSLSNLTEFQLGTDPCASDTGGDGLSDGAELAGVTGAKAALGTFMTDPLNADTDGDGCTDGAEVGADETRGGRRDPLNRYDFYDVNGDAQVDVLNDLLPVILAYLQGPLDFGGPGPNYTTAKDRGALVGANSWNRAGPDGHIDVLNDLLPMIFQFGHDCRIFP